jgi:hypothetical protein
MDLIETKGNPENYNFYNWNLIDIHIDSSYKRNLKDNMDAIINIVEKQVINITTNTEGYTIEYGEVFLDLGLINCPDCHNFIDIYGYCKC